MAKLGNSACFLLEAFYMPRINSQMRTHKLNSQALTCLAVVGGIHDAHAAASQLFLDHKPLRQSKAGEVGQVDFWIFEFVAGHAQIVPVAGFIKTSAIV